MTTITTTVLLDDLDGSVIEKGETITFAFQGITYEIDLTEIHANELRAVLSPYVKAGRPVPRMRPAAARRNRLATAKR